MPLYEYRCKACGHRFEKIQTFSAPDEKECPACQGEVERLISAPAVQFKGSGFYSTDYPSKSAAAPKASSGDGGAKDSGKSESAAASGEGGSKSGSESSAAPSSAPAASSSTTSPSSSKE